MQLWAYTNALNVALKCRIMNTMIFALGVEIELKGGNNDNQRAL